MLLRDRLRARIADMGDARDHQRLAAEVLGIRNAPPDLARRLVSQALVVEDRREAWRLAGERICATAPATPGVYVLRDGLGRALYVGKAINLRRRLRTHFAGRRWRGLKAELARATDAEWQEVGSELEALLREAELIHELEPIVNVQTGPPDLDARRIPRALVRDVIVVLRSVEPDSAQFVAARKDGGWLIQRTRRSGADLAVHTARLLRFFVSPLRRSFNSAPFAPIVFSWLAGRGASATRLDPHDTASPYELRARLAALLADEALFAERIVVMNRRT
jgi:hypothetical protein